MRNLVRLLAALALVWASARSADAAPQLVADLFAGKAGLQVGMYPPYSVGFEGVTYFPATDAQHGAELWRTDGTVPGTFRLTDVCPGECGAIWPPLAVRDGTIYFVADDGERGYQLWRTGGTPDTETRVPGVCATAQCAQALAGATEWRGAFWFLIVGADRVPTLWTTDLTPAGTRAVANLCTDLAICGFDEQTNAFLGQPSPNGEGLLLSVYGLQGSTLYRTDGTVGGTEVLHRSGAFAPPAPGSFGPVVAPLRAGASAVHGPRRAAAAPRLAERASAAGEPLFLLYGSDLWTSDGTAAGTRFVRSIADLLVYESSYVQSTLVVDGVWYATFSYGEWIRSDGTAAGTVRIADRLPSSFLPTVARIGARVFAVTVGGVYEAGVTAETTQKVVTWSVGDVLQVITQGDRLFVLTWINGGVVWTTDGTAAGTHRLRPPKGPPIDQYSMAALGDDGVLFTRGADRLWRTDSTGTAASELHDFQPANGPSLTEGDGVLGGRLLFYARDRATRARLFASDGTAAGTALVSGAVDDPIASPYYGAEAHVFARAGASLVFNAFGRLFATDGSERGTRPIVPPLGSYSSPTSFAPIASLGARLLFVGRPLGLPHCGPGEAEPWITDGSRRGTRQVADINRYHYDGGGSLCEDLPLGSEPGPGVALGETALFPANDLVHGNELFASDGTAKGTRLVADLNLATKPNDVSDPSNDPARIGVGSDPRDLVRLGSLAFFTADDGTHGREVWVSNGTGGGTHLLADLAPGAAGSSPHDLVAFDGRVVFVAAVGGREALFASDGTAHGTVRVSAPQAAFTRARSLQVAGGRLYFVGFTPTTGSELWTSAGRPRSTHLVRDLRPGPRGSAPQHLAAVGGRLVFAATDGVHGLEPWSSDGTAAGTVALGDLAAGEASSNPGPFRVVSGRLVFGADDGAHGRELWALPVAEVGAPQNP